MRAFTFAAALAACKSSCQRPGFVPSHRLPITETSPDQFAVAPVSVPVVVGLTASILLPLPVLVTETTFFDPSSARAVEAVRLLRLRDPEIVGLELKTT